MAVLLSFQPVAPSHHSRRVRDCRHRLIPCRALRPLCCRNATIRLYHRSKVRRDFSSALLFLQGQAKQISGRPTFDARLRWEGRYPVLCERARTVPQKRRGHALSRRGLSVTLDALLHCDADRRTQTARSRYRYRVVARVVVAAAAAPASTARHHERERCNCQRGQQHSRHPLPPPSQRNSCQHCAEGNYAARPRQPRSVIRCRSRCCDRQGEGVRPTGA